MLFIEENMLSLSQKIYDRFRSTLDPGILIALLNGIFRQFLISL